MLDGWNAVLNPGANTNAFEKFKGVFLLLLNLLLVALLSTRHAYLFTRRACARQAPMPLEIGLHSTGQLQLIWTGAATV